MGDFFKAIGRFFAFCDTVELIVPAALSILLLVVCPPFIIVWLAVGHRYLIASGAAIVWCLAIWSLVRDFRNHRVSWATGSLLAVWFLGAVVIMWRLNS